MGTTTMKRHEGMYQRAGRWYGDFRGYAAEGGRREPLTPMGERFATPEFTKALRLYEARLAELMAERVKRHPAEATQEPETGNGVISLRWALQAHIERYRSLVDPRETRNRERHRDIIVGILPPSIPVVDLRVSHVHTFLQYLREDYRQANGEPLSGPYRAKILGTLRLALDEAVYAGFITANPARTIPPTLRPSQITSETGFYTVEQAGRILSALRRSPDGGRPADWSRDIPDYVYEQVAFALLTGARRNELQAQRWEWIDWQSNTIQLYTSKRYRGEDRGKMLEHSVRTVPLWPQLRAALDALWIRQGRPATGLVFPPLRLPTRPRVHAKPLIERGGRVDKAVRTLLRLRGVITGGMKGEPLLFEGLPGFQLSWREFRVTYCATRLQTVEPVAGRPGEWVPVARRTVELEMGHASEEMVNKVYGRVAAGKQLRLQAVGYPLQSVAELVEGYAVAATARAPENQSHSAADSAEFTDVQLAAL